MTFSSRKLVGELMDDPELPRDQHVAALRGLTRLNAVSGSARALWPAVRAAGTGGRRVNLVDVACGGGDVALGLLRRAARAGVDLHVTGVDNSPVALDVAAAAAHAAGLADRTTWRPADVLRDGLPGGAHVVMSNLFLHHLTAEQTTGVLASMRDAADAPGAVVLINDLCRGPVAQGLVTLGSYALSRSAVVHTDGPRSARAAWTPHELRGLAADAGLDGARVSRCWPCRMLLRWSRP